MLLVIVLIVVTAKGIIVEIFTSNHMSSLQVVNNVRVLTISLIIFDHT